MKEKRKVLVHRIVWLSILILMILLPIIINVAQPELELVDIEASKEYYSGLNESEIDMKLTFNRKVDNGYATIKYYDSSNNLLKTDKGYFTAYGSKTAESFLIYIDGNVDYYELISYEFEPITIGMNIYMLLPPVIILFACSLLINYKEYEFDGKKISIYAGWYHHTLRVNEEKYDEHNTFTTFVPIKLSTTLEDNTKLEATITLTNRISLKANDKLLKNIKKTDKKEETDNTQLIEEIKKEEVLDEKKSI